MTALLKRLNAAPYWLVALIVTAFVGIGLFTGLAIAGNAQDAAFTAGQLSALCLLGFALTSLTMPPNV